MTSLLDIGPLTEKIKIGDKEVNVFGVTPEGFFFLLEKFPMLQTMFGGGIKNITMELLREVAPTSIAYAIAIATTDRSRYETQSTWVHAVQEAANIAVNLSAHYQMELFQSALRLTFPDGIGPFMKGVERMADSINRVSGQTAPAMTSSKPSRSGFVTDSPGLRLGKGRPSASSAH